MHSESLQTKILQRLQDYKVAIGQPLFFNWLVFTYLWKRKVEFCSSRHPRAECYVGAMIIRNSEVVYWTNDFGLVAASTEKPTIRAELYGHGCQFCCFHLRDCKSEQNCCRPEGPMKQVRSRGDSRRQCHAKVFCAPIIFVPLNFVVPRNYSFKHITLKQNLYP